MEEHWGTRRTNREPLNQIEIHSETIRNKYTIIRIQRAIAFMEDTIFQLKLFNSRDWSEVSG